MTLTERQRRILNKIIEEHIDSAEPVSSSLLEEKYDFGICPATIRIEMRKLTSAGLITQPHTSAGRIPTDKGYRFYVNELLEENLTNENIDLWVTDEEIEEIKDTIKFLQSLTKNLASISSNLAIGYLFKEKILLKEGWEEILKEPEFQEKKLISNFTNLLKVFEEEIENLKINSGIKIFIGKENPFFKVRDFSIILSKCHFPETDEGVLALLGPKRMTYEKNISSLSSIIKLVENLG